MKKITILILLIFALCKWGSTQDKAFDPTVTVKWAPTGLLVGNIAMQGEYSFNAKSSLTAKIGVPAGKNYHSKFHGKEIDINMKAFSFMTGYRHYLSKRKLSGFYYEPYFKYVHQTAGGLGETTLDNQPVTLNFTNTYNAFGFGLQLGTQFIIHKRFVLDLFFLGPEINSVNNSFRAIDPAGSESWTNIEASQAEGDIRNFLDQFPFIKNRVDVKVDKNNKSVNADFNGWVGALRFGFSIGYAF
ncbi:MAG: DUF3575 domain-containing protein [Bacteroidetes bacterium]|nr:DUF3575 domain-containing protein [Bacteroidota bacterium]